jgi:23S rRNA (adenine-N6)-dimethyltransferase
VSAERRTTRSRGRRTTRDARRRSLGQNFLRPERARRLVANAGFRPGQLVVEIGAGRGALTRALAREPIDVLAVELDPDWCARLRASLREIEASRVRVVAADFLRFRLPTRPFRVIGALPFARTTEICRRLFDDPSLPLERADLIVQWEVARKRASEPPHTRLSASWAPWWRFALAGRVDARAFRPVPRVDAGVLVATRREPPLLPEAMAPAYARFVAASWPFHGVRRVRSPRSGKTRRNA